MPALVEIPEEMITNKIKHLDLTEDLIDLIEIIRNQK